MRRLEDILDLPPLVEAGKDEEPSNQVVNVEEAREILHSADTALDRINTALPTINDLETSDKELDDLAKLAQDKFEDLVELGMNVEPKNSGPILQAASSLLGHALNAKMAKMNRKLQVVDLQLKKARLDLAVKNSDKKADEEDPIEGKGMVLNRNDLLKELIAQSKKSGS